ncbi:pirin family protein [Vibrio rumoiensis]|uniref:pirin family protein n=1 Tax=Vibrio rumoiensis TaxID=76258 RepID=UPI003AA7EAE1
MSNREIIYRTFGQDSGFITRLVSPSDLGQYLKPFVFLDLFCADIAMARKMLNGGGMPLHPHSGIATITVVTDGYLRFSDPESGTGKIEYGGVEWMLAGGGVWHGKEMIPDHNSGFTGFQLWIALPPHLENSAPQSRYIESKDMLRVGPAHVILGDYQNVKSPVPSPLGINYLLVTLKKNQTWRYNPPKGHSVAWMALSKGKVKILGDSCVDTGEMVMFNNDEEGIDIQSLSEEAVFVLGSAIPHEETLHLGSYSVHTSAEALVAGEKRIIELRNKIRSSKEMNTEIGTVPIFR